MATGLIRRPPALHIRRLHHKKASTLAEVAGESGQPELRDPLGQRQRASLNRAIFPITRTMDGLGRGAGFAHQRLRQV